MCAYQYTIENFKNTLDWIRMTDPSSGDGIKLNLWQAEQMMRLFQHMQMNPDGMCLLKPRNKI